jgi:hypothetical protein
MVNPTGFDPGSFRDKSSRVFYHEGRVARALSREALANWELLQIKPFFRRLSAAGRIIGTRAGTIPAPSGAWAGVLEHDAIPFISYPYEWSFGMLRDAALLQLELVEAALGEGMTLKDATPYNVQWIGAQPVFIDIPSFVPWKPGMPWVGYQQFCQLTLYPLWLQSLRGAPFHPWLRGAIDGITVEQMRGLVSLRDCLRPGVFSHVLLQAQLQKRYGGAEMRREFREGTFNQEMILANVRGLRKIVAGLLWRPGRSPWSEYADQRNYSSEDYERKRGFVGDACRSAKPAVVWDLGCNTGDFSRLAAEHAATVVAMDADHWVVENVYKSVKEAGPDRILPLVMNLADPSPSLGWLGAERRSISDRGRPGLILALALIHHLAITANIPLEELIRWLASFAADLVIEFVTPQDPLARRLLERKDEPHPDYNRDHFERVLAAHFSIDGQLDLNSGRRRLYHCGARN